MERKQAARLNLKYYYTGRPCKYGHMAKRITANGHCLECHRIANRIYYEENKEKFNALYRKRRAKLSRRKTESQ